MSERERLVRRLPRSGILAASISAIIASNGVGSVALGQDQDDEAANDQTETMVVTGTRIRRDDFNAANATTVVTGAEMEALGIVSVADMVNQLPNNIATVSPEATAASPFYLGASIANMRGLNTAYGVRTLTLVDSRRVTPTNNGGGVDMNFIPSALVGRIETVTGGASATYGSDAMAGVVNVILDDSIETMRIDLNYQTTAEGDGDQYTLSFGTGFQFFDNRAQLTIGLDSSRQDAIEDCTTREFCRRSQGLFRNGLSAATYGDRGDDIVYPGLPEYYPTLGQRYTVTDRGVIPPVDVEFPAFGADPGDAPPTQVDPDDLTLGWYQFNEEGTDLVPYLDHLLQGDLSAINSVGTLTSLFAGANFWGTPFGEGKLIYEDVPIVPETNRDNLFMRFAYQLEGGIEITANLTYGQTDSTTLQNASRGNLQGLCILPWNAYVQGPATGGNAGQLLRDVFAARGVGGDFFTPGDTNIDCLQAPYLGGTYNERDDETDAGTFDFPAVLEIHKDFSNLVDRRNLNKSEAMSLALGATGDLFEGGSWTWDAYAQFGQTENRQTLSGWRAARRWDMALDSVIEPDTGEVVCSIDSETATSTQPIDGIPTVVNHGDFTRNKWEDYIRIPLRDSITEDQVQALLNDYRAGCVPFNPFGNARLTPEQVAYVFPTLFEGTDNDQTMLQISFSGDAWRGIGDAGPMQMAAGYDWRENDTQNIADPNRFLGADFNFVGNSSSGAFDRIYGDNWWGRTTTEEAWVEFDLPLLRDRIAADSLVFNTSFRRTENETKRVAGVEGIDTPDTTREVDSWKATMVWRPIDMMTVRLTRSADVRAPSARELYATNSYALESGGQTETTTRFRFNVPSPPFGDPDFEGFTESGDQIIRVDAGNASLSSERSITETLGLVFQPSDAIPGLQVSIDYYETTIKGGIEGVDFGDTLNLCYDEIGGFAAGENDDGSFDPGIPESEWEFCGNIEFGEPDPTQEFYVTGATAPAGFFVTEDVLNVDGTPVMDGDPNPYYQYTNIISIAESTRNQAPYWSRGIDYSVSYFTQLGGGGTISTRALLTRFLEQSVFSENLWGRYDVSGQVGGNNLISNFGSFGVNYSPTPRTRGNLFLTYSKNAFSLTAQALYTGTGKLNQQERWLQPNDVITFTDYDNGFPDPNPIYPLTVAYAPNLSRTTLRNELPSWTTLNLNFNYNFGRSRLQLDRFESLSAYLNIENVGDRIPQFFSGTGAGGINTALYSGMGRSYRMGVRMEF